MTVSNRVKVTLDPVDDVDHLSDDMLIDIAMGLERQTWMLGSAAANG